MSDSSKNQLSRALGVSSASLLGLGSILGTGVFVSIGLAAQVAGPAVLIAVVLAAMIATFNGLSSAQLAAAHPVSGGTYEYGHKFLHPLFGFSAGWLFLVAKSASAATAALGVSSYLLNALETGVEPSRVLTTAIALAFVVAIIALVIGGVRRSSRVNTIIVAITVAALVAFVVGLAPDASKGFEANISARGR